MILKASSIAGVVVLALILTPLHGCATTARQQSGEPGVLQTTIPVGQLAVPATLHLSGFAEPQPTVIWFHGFPGLPELGDETIAALRDEGLNVLTLHYRGSWGAPGTFGAASALEDARAAIAYLRSTATVAQYGVDPDRIVLMGDSFGSWVALQTAARDPLIRCAGAALVFDVGGLGAEMSRDAAVRSGFEEMFAKIEGDSDLGYTMKAGASGLADEIVSEHDHHALATLVSFLRDRPLFLLGAEGDELAPVDLHLRPFSAALQEAGNDRVAEKIVPGGHELSNSSYAPLFADWVTENCH